jgi:hypothetical protein
LQSDELPLLTLPATVCRRFVQPAVAGAFELRREGGGCAWRAELVDRAMNLRADRTSESACF